MATSKLHFTKSLTGLICYVFLLWRISVSSSIYFHHRVYTCCLSNSIQNICLSHWNMKNKSSKAALICSHFSPCLWLLWDMSISFFPDLTSKIVCASTAFGNVHLQLWGIPVWISASSPPGCHIWQLGEAVQSYRWGRSICQIPTVTGWRTTEIDGGLYI